MRAYIARNGNRSGPFEMETIKQMASSGGILPTDFAFLEGSEAWKLASEVPELNGFFIPSIPPPPPPVVIPEPPIYSNISAPIQNPALAPSQPTSPELEFQGYPSSYWEAYFGDRTIWFLDKFKGLPTLEDEELEEKNLKTLGPKGRAKHKLMSNFKFLANIRFALPGLIFGWMWVAYRRALGFASGILFVLSIMFLFIKGAATHAATFQSEENIETNTFVLNLCAILAFSVLPFAFGVRVIHFNVLSEFKAIEKLTSDPIERLRRIKEKGGTSWLNVAAFGIIYLIVILVVL